jgi:hypothetical protein
VGDRVEIHAERDGDVAELFSGAIKDAHSESMTASTSVAVNAAGGGQ